jgi:hypothetical protein
MGIILFGRVGSGACSDVVAPPYHVQFLLDRLRIRDITRFVFTLEKSTVASVRLNPRTTRGEFNVPDPYLFVAFVIVSVVNYRSVTFSSVFDCLEPSHDGNIRS